MIYDPPGMSQRFFVQHSRYQLLIEELFFFAQDAPLARKNLANLMVSLNNKMFFNF